MTTLYRNTGADTTTFPLNPSFPSGGQSQDLNVLSIVASGSSANGTWKRPDTPSGWTLVTHPSGANWNTFEHTGSNVTYYMYVKVGAFTGPLGNITWSGAGSMPTYGIAAIDIFGCSSGETWDFSVYSIGKQQLSPPIPWKYDTTASKFGTQNGGRIDLGPGDMVFIATALNTENAGYPINTWTSGGMIISDSTKYYPGSGVTGSYANVDNTWIGDGSGWLGYGLTLIRSWFRATSTKAPYGAPRFATPLYNPSNGFTIHARFTLREKSGNDARPIVDATKIFGLTSADTASMAESSRDNGVLNANVNFSDGVANWTGQNGATLSQSFAQFKNGDSSMLITPDGVTSGPQAVSEELTIIKNSYYKAHAWMRGNGLAIAAGIFWYNSSHSFMSSTMTDTGGSANGSWREYTVYGKAPPGAVYARLAITGPGVVSSGNAWYVDEAYISDGSVRTTATVPYPRRWKNGDIPTATVLNRDWRDTFNWLLTSKPCFVGSSTDTTNWTVSQWFPIVINVEEVRQSFIHTANDSKVYVTEDGWYEALLTITRDSTGATTTAKDITGLLVNGTMAYTMGYHEPHIADSDKVASPDPVNLYLSAGDYVELAVYSLATSGTVKNWSGSAEARPRLEIWWSGR